MSTRAAKERWEARERSEAVEANRKSRDLHRKAQAILLNNGIKCDVRDMSEPGAVFSKYALLLKED